MDVSTQRKELIGLAQRRETQSFIGAVHRVLGHTVDVLDALHVLHYTVWLTETGDQLWQELLRRGCNPFVRDFNGDSSLHYAIRSCNLRYLQYLYNHLGPITLKVVNHQLCDLLITCCAETSDERSHDFLMCLEWLYFMGMSLEAQDSQGKTPLMWAAQRGSQTICQWLISRGAHVAHRDHMNRTALHVACSSGSYEVALFLCRKGAVNLIGAESYDDRRVNTPFKIAWQRGHLWLAISLLSWRVCYSLSGVCSLVHSPYAWSALALILWNFVCGEFMIYDLSRVSGRPKNLVEIWVSFNCLLLITLVFWLTAAKKDPGSVTCEKLVLPSQHHLCSESGERDLRVFEKSHANLIGTASQRLRTLEVNAKSVALQVAKISKSGTRMREVRAKLERSSEILSQLSDEVNTIRESVGIERRAAANKAYVKRVCDTGNQSVCLTCHSLKNIRQHHCNECGVCVRRFDHHCVWIDNCVGLGNQSFFLAFLYTMVSGIVYYYVVFGLYVKCKVTNTTIMRGAIPLNNGNDLITHNLLELLLSPLFYASAFNVISNIMWFGFSTFLLVRTTRSMITDVTFYETLKRFDYIQHRYGSSRQTFGHACWDFADINAVNGFLNSFHFLMQSDKRDAVNYAIKETSLPLMHGASRPFINTKLNKGISMTTTTVPVNVRYEDMPIDWRLSTMNLQSSIEPSPSNIFSQLPGRRDEY